MEKILDRFLRYVAVDTQSDENSPSQPSTAKQLNLLKLLCEELKGMGIDAVLDEYGYVMGRIPSNLGGRKVPAVGFIAHVDTAPDASGKDVKPQIVENYDGGDIPLRGVPGLALKPSEFPELLHYVGQTLITTDGTTLLGADDKAGVAEIMDAVAYITAHPELPHGDICIGFTPDEEIGRGVVKFDVPRFGADYAYTMDGGEIGELEFENFNAASARIRIQGSNVHPGYAKGKMRNAILIGQEFNALLPAWQRPEYTEGYEGFFHLISFKGSVEEAEFAYIIRDHDRARFEARKAFMEETVRYMNTVTGGCFTLEMKDSYYNMRELIEDGHMDLVENAKAAMLAHGVTPKIVAIRGGTDGAMLTYKGLPCPNLSVGGENFHGVHEFACVEDMEAMVKVLVTLTR